ncbi:MAG: hypothetical protein D6710_08970 [Nitrospirae bacterium]|nr:MAG: hypothetical protein D6710_08970 [Nitrospirota bacterium]
MVFSIVPFASADEKRPVTPYGDFCPNCSRYGFCKFNLSIEEARKALEDYYKQQGLSVRIEKSMGRFIRATVFREDKAVDRIILDRRTGRIRSIY